MKHGVRAKTEIFLLLAPGVIIYTIFNLIPLMTLLILALFKWSGSGDPEYVGAENIIQIFSNEYLREELIRALSQNIIYFLVIIVLMLFLGTLIAMLLSVKVPFHGMYKIIYFIPYPLSAVAVSYLLDMLINPRGPLNAVLVGAGLIDQPIPFLGDTSTALGTIGMFYVWHKMGFAIVMILAALLAVRSDLLEAAVLDKANKFQLLRHIVFPVLIPVFIVITVIVMVEVFNNADYTLVLMGPEAGPSNSTDIMATFMFRNAFGSFNSAGTVNLGMAATIALITAVIILPFSIFLAMRNMKDS